MSSVTDIILVTALRDGSLDDEHKNADRLTTWLQSKGGPANKLVHVNDHAGGDKHIQCDVFLAAINYLDHEGFLAAFRSIAWEMPDCVQLMLKGEQENLFTVHLAPSSPEVT